MSVSGITSTGMSALSLSALTPQSSDSTSATSIGSAPASRDQFRSDLKALFEAVKSSDMTAAQEALKSLQNDRPEMFSGTTPAQGGTSYGLHTDLQALINAIASGDASGAQDALTKLQSDVQAQGTRHHQGHHHRNNGAASASGTTATDATTATSTGGDRDGDGDGR